jgi:hypothetical protein
MLSLPVIPALKRNINKRIVVQAGPGKNARPHRK